MNSGRDRSLVEIETEIHPWYHSSDRDIIIISISISKYRYLYFPVCRTCMWIAHTTIYDTKCMSWSTRTNWKGNRATSSRSTVTCCQADLLCAPEILWIPWIITQQVVPTLSSCLIAQKYVPALQQVSCASDWSHHGKSPNTIGG